VEQIEHGPAPASQFGDDDYVDLAGLRQRKHLLAFGAVLLRAGGGFLPDSDDFVASLPCEGAELTFLAGTGVALYLTCRLQRFAVLNL
jgi:hypothetical protein